MKTLKFYTPAFFVILVLSMLALLYSCDKDEVVTPTDLELAIAEYDMLKASGEFVEFSVPDQNPGPPFYARIAELGPDRLFMESGDLVIIPMMRQINCIDVDFNLLTLFHVPEAFTCPLTLSGNGLIEPNATPEQFPLMAYLESTSMPVWFIDREPLLIAMQDGVLTIAELEMLNPLKGVASRYIEYNKPRTAEDHLLVIESEGTIPATNQHFEYKVKSITKAKQEVNLKIW